MPSTIQYPAEAERVVKARIQLLTGHPWFGTLALNLKVIEDLQTKTMATNGTKLWYNPTWTQTQAAGPVLGTVAHEACHCGLRHMFRFGGRDADLWNQACDYVINLILLESGFELPEGVLIDQRFVGMSAETVYAILLRERNQKREQERQDQQDQNSDEGEASDDDPQDDSDQGDQDDDDDQGSEGDQGDDDQDGPESYESDDESDGQDPGDGSGAGAGSDDDGDHGDLIPAPTDEVDEDGEPNLGETDWQIATEQASMVAAKRGLLPADAERAFQETIEPKVDWREVLRRFVEQTMPSDYSWSQPNRRFIGSGMYLPALIKSNTPRLLVAIDTSMSIDLKALASFTSELTEIVAEVRPAAIDVICCDARVQSVDTFTSDDEIKVKVRGGGGTAFTPVFDWVADQDEQPAAIIYFTDLEGDEPVEPEIPVLWVVPEYVTRQGLFGETVRIPSA